MLLQLTWWWAWAMLYVHAGQASVAIGLAMWFMLKFLLSAIWVSVQDEKDHDEGIMSETNEDDVEIEESDGETMIPINPVEPTSRPRRIAKGLLVDTGAGATLDNGEENFPEYRLESSPGSRAGQEYAGPGMADTIKNRGQRRARIRLGSEKGQLTSICFQDAAVRRPILSVGESVEADNLYIFDRLGSAILLNGCPEIIEIRRLVQQAQRKIEMIKDRNTFKVDAFVEPNHEAAARPFKR